PHTVSVTPAVKSAKWLPLTASAPSVPPVGYTFHAPAISPSRAKVTGSREAVDAVQQLLVKVDSGSTAGTINDDFSIVALDKQNNQVPDVVVKPGTAHVRIELARVPAAKTLIISPAVTGTPSFPFQITRIDVSPQTVTVSGRPEQLSQVSTLPTQPLDVAGATADVSRPMALVLPPGLTLVGAPNVTVTVHIASPPPAPGGPAAH
nr:CdaR family protein [Armatimonadota bacterium]